MGAGQGVPTEGDVGGVGAEVELVAAGGVGVVGEEGVGCGGGVVVVGHGRSPAGGVVVLVYWMGCGVVRWVWSCWMKVRVSWWAVSRVGVWMVRMSSAGLVWV